jgi:hypothetical protein
MQKLILGIYAAMVAVPVALAMSYEPTRYTVININQLEADAREGETRLTYGLLALDGDVYDYSDYYGTFEDCLQAARDTFQEHGENLLHIDCVSADVTQHLPAMYDGMDLFAAGRCVATDNHWSTEQEVLAYYNTCPEAKRIPLGDIWVGVLTLDANAEESPTDDILWNNYTPIAKFESRADCETWLESAFQTGAASMGSCQPVVWTRAYVPDHSGEGAQP